MLPLIALVGAAVVGFAAATYWDDILANVKDFFQKIDEIWENLRTHVDHETQIIGDWIRDKIKIINRVFFKVKGKYYKQDGIQEIDASEVPSRIRAKLRDNETDITEEIKKELRLAYS